MILWNVDTLESNHTTTVASQRLRSRHAYICTTEGEAGQRAVTVNTLPAESENRSENLVRG
jgi:hypothetical protein